MIKKLQNIGTFWYILFFGLIVRILFYATQFNSELWKLHMLGRFDERAQAIMNFTMQKNLSAWGSYPVLLSFFYKILDCLHLYNFRLQILYWIYQAIILLMSYRIYKFFNTHRLNNAISISVLSVFFIFNPFVIYIYSLNMSETLYVFVFWILFEFLVSLKKVKERFDQTAIIRTIGIGALCALLIILRNMGLLLAGTVIVMYSYYLINYTSQTLLRIQLLAALFLGFIFPLGSVLVLNKSLDPINGYSININKGANLAQTWCEAPSIDFENLDNAFWFRPPALWKVDNSGALFFEEDFKESQFYLKKAVNCFLDNPKVLQTRFRSLLNVYIGDLYPDPLKWSSHAASMVFGFSSLVIFLFLLLEVIFLRNGYHTKIALLLISTQLAAVFLGNMGEMRFLFSFYPLLLVVFVCINRWSLKHSIILGLALGISLLLYHAPTTAELVKSQQQTRVEELFTEKSTNFLKMKQNLLPHVDLFAFQSQCNADLPLAVSCERSQNEGCFNDLQIKSEILKLNRRVLSENQLYCRNYYLSKIQTVTHESFSESQVQLPAPLLQPLSRNTLVAMAAQFLQYKLLRESKISFVANPNETELELLRTLLKFQLYQKQNAESFKYAVLPELTARKPDKQSATILYLTLDLM